MGAQKLDHPVSLDQANTSPVGSSSNKRSRTPPRQNLEGWDHRQREYHLVPYFPTGPPMLGPWGPPPMMYLPYPPWVRWDGPWAPPPMHFHLGWLGSAGGHGHRGYYTGDDHHESIG
jgi:hypothetical protein